MPLHTGYDDDHGGNQRIVQYDTMKTHNLHRFWDEDIIKLTNITDQDCLQYYNNSIDTLKAVDFVAWMNDSRSLLPGVYDFPDFNLDKAYLLKNKVIVEKQLLKAGLRLALLLNKLFYSPTTTIDFKEVIAKYKNGIDINDAMKYIGKIVTICTHVYGVKISDNVTFINLGKSYPNSPITLVIFKKDRKNFPLPTDEMYSDKNICVQGELVEYKGKAEIIVTKPEEIIIQ
jgi:hypothetical protein